MMTFGDTPTFGKEDGWCYAGGTIDLNCAEWWQYDLRTGSSYGLDNRFCVWDGTNSVTVSHRQKCPYCGSNSELDKRGNCIACGAPK